MQNMVEFAYSQTALYEQLDQQERKDAESAAQHYLLNAALLGNAFGCSADSPKRSHGTGICRLP